MAESAALIGASEVALRTWLARNISTDYNGAKTGSRLYLSGRDCFYFLLVRHLTHFGVPVRTAMYAAAEHVDATEDELPSEDFLVVRTDGATTTFSLTTRPEFGETTLILPLRTLAEDLIAAATVVYALNEAGEVV